MDFNVPQDKKDPSIVTNTARIEGAMPTIQHCLDAGAKAVILMSHLGRPDGLPKPEFSMVRARGLCRRDAAAAPGSGRAGEVAFLGASEHAHTSSD